ncbi:MAG: flavodoxin [Candidatus Lokiarchaeota archaeon]|nr:flavodoxin [Candidatus Lokiarchaeota archaeon]
MAEKYLVVCYSRSGATKAAAEAIASHLSGCDIDEIKSKKYDAGFMGIITAGIDSITKAKAEVESTLDPSAYDHVIVGTPVWGFTAANPVLTYLANNKGKFKAVSFFSCSLLSGGLFAFDAMQEACGMTPVAKLDLGDTEVRQKSPLFERHVNKFLMQLRACSNVSSSVH